MNKEEVVNYWVESAEQDAQAMENLFGNGHYVWALFIGHLVIEKLLKAYYAQRIDVDAPRTHDLLKIAVKAGIELSEEQKDFLDEVTTFNIKARYPDYKKRFYNKATRDFAEGFINRIKEFRLWLLNKINS